MICSTGPNFEKTLNKSKVCSSWVLRFFIMFGVLIKFNLLKDNFWRDWQEASNSLMTALSALQPARFRYVLIKCWEIMSATCERKLEMFLKRHNSKKYLHYILHCMAFVLRYGKSFHLMLFFLQLGWKAVKRRYNYKNTGRIYNM